MLKFVGVVRPKVFCVSRVLCGMRGAVPLSHFISLSPCPALARLVSAVMTVLASQILQVAVMMVFLLNRFTQRSLVCSR